MIRSILKAGVLTSLFVGATLFSGCGNKSSTSSQRAAVRTNQSYCDPNYTANCNYRGTNGLNNNNLNNNCGTNNILTDYGCMPRGNCPANYGYDQQSNQCFPAAQTNGNYYQQGNYNQYNQNSYNGYSQNYNDPYYYNNQNYNQNSYYDPYQSNYYGY